MAIQSFSGERFTLTTSRSFGDVVSTIERAVAHPNVPELFRNLKEAPTPEAVEDVVEMAVGPLGLMEFLRLDFGVMLRKDKPPTDRSTLRFLLGNPLIMRELVRGVPAAGLNAPVTVLVDGHDGEVQISYDRMAAALPASGEPHALQVARELDAKIERILYEAAGQGSPA